MQRPVSHMTDSPEILQIFLSALVLKLSPTCDKPVVITQEEIDRVGGSQLSISIDKFNQTANLQLKLRTN